MKQLLMCKFVFHGAITKAGVISYILYRILNVIRELKICIIFKTCTNVSENSTRL